MKEKQIGYLLRANTSGCVAGCRVSALHQPELGGMVSIRQAEDLQIYGLLYDIHIDDDGLVRQLVTAEAISAEVIEDNRLHRTVPVELSIVFTGYRRHGNTYHLLPPRPPLTLDDVELCSEDELCEFTSQGRFGYFRHVLRGTEYPVAEIFASHLKLAARAHHSAGSSAWIDAATQELITLLRDDYPTLMNVLGALADAQLTALED